MATYVIEAYLARARVSELDAATARLCAAIATFGPVSSPDRPPQHVRSLFLPEDEMALHLIEAPSMVAAIEICRRAGLDQERIVEAGLEHAPDRGDKGEDSPAE